MRRKQFLYKPLLGYRDERLLSAHTSIPFSISWGLYWLTQMPCAGYQHPQPQHLMCCQANWLSLSTTLNLLQCRLKIWRHGQRRIPSCPESRSLSCRAGWMFPLMMSFCHILPSNMSLVYLKVVYSGDLILSFRDQDARCFWSSYTRLTQESAGWRVLPEAMFDGPIWVLTWSDMCANVLSVSPQGHNLHLLLLTLGRFLSSHGIVFI